MSFTYPVYLIPDDTPRRKAIRHNFYALLVNAKLENIYQRLKPSYDLETGEKLKDMPRTAYDVRKLSGEQIEGIYKGLQFSEDEPLKKIGERRKAVGQVLGVPKSLAKRI